MKKLTTLIFLPLSLMAISGTSQAGIIPEAGLTFTATGTSGVAAPNSCTASLTNTTADFGAIDLTKPVLLENPFGLRIYCTTPQKVKFTFRDNGYRPTSSPAFYSILTGEGESLAVYNDKLSFGDLIIKAGDTPGNLAGVGLYMSSELSSQATMLYRIPLFFGKKAYKHYQLDVGKAYNTPRSTTPNTGKEVWFSGTFEIEYGF